MWFPNSILPETANLVFLSLFQFAQFIVPYLVHLNEEVIKRQIKALVRGSVEEALNELLEADITEALWGSMVSPEMVNKLNKKAYVHIEDVRNALLKSKGLLCLKSVAPQRFSEIVIS